MQRRDFVRTVGAGLGAAALTRRLDAAIAPFGETHTMVGADRMAWWREARFGMFIHFGLYSVLGGEWKGKETGSHEWIRNNAKIPHEEYVELVHRFDPRALDVDAWVRLAKEAGQRYVVFTSKHHEGFSMWDSKVTTYDVMATPYGRDVVRQVAEACRRHGMKFGLYYSIMDWYHPDYLPRRDWESRDASGADFTRYLAFMRAQLRELLTQYGDVAVLWFDGQWEPTWNHPLAAQTLEEIRALMPNVIVNNRLDVKGEGDGASDTRRASGHVGDYSTPELEVPTRGFPGEDWETCMTMNRNWGWSKFDHDFKSVPQLVSLLVETASKGGNLLLNVGPMDDGRIPQESIDGLRGVGAWMRVNGEAIYGSTATPFDAAPVRVTSQPRRLNLFMEKWASSVVLPGLRTLPRRAHILGERGNEVKWRASGEGVIVTLPERAPSALTPVVTLQFDQEPRVAS